MAYTVYRAGDVVEGEPTWFAFAPDTAAEYSAAGNSYDRYDQSVRPVYQYVIDFDGELVTEPDYGSNFRFYDDYRGVAWCGKTALAVAALVGAGAIQHRDRIEDHEHHSLVVLRPRVIKRERLGFLQRCEWHAICAQRGWVDSSDEKFVCAECAEIMEE